MDIIQKLSYIKTELSKINEQLLIYENLEKENHDKKEILDILSDIYINTQICAQHLKYLKMKDCNHIFIKRHFLSCKEPVTYCICCGLNNAYEHINSDNYIMNKHDIILRKCYETTKDKGLLLSEEILSEMKLEEMLNKYKEYNTQTIKREELVLKLKQNHKKSKI